MPVRYLRQPFGLLDRLGADYDAVEACGYELVHGVGGAYASADLRGDAAFLDDPPEDGDVALPAEGRVQIHEVEVLRSLLDPHRCDRHGVREDDLLASGDSSDELDHLVVHDVHCRDHLHRTDSAKDMKFLRNVIPEPLLFSGWNCVP